MKLKKLFYLIRFIFLDYKTPLYMAVERGNIDIVQILLSNENIEINTANIKIHVYL